MYIGLYKTPNKALSCLVLSIKPPPPPTTLPSLLILHYQMNKQWTDLVWFFYSVEVRICFDLWLQDP